MQLPEQKLYIGGQYVSARSGQIFYTTNPATNEHICAVHTAGRADVDDAIHAAHQGFRIWSSMTGTERARILMNAVRLLRERNDELAELEVLDTGKPIREAQTVDVVTGADCIEYYAGLAPTLHGHHYDLQTAFAYTRREPLGICAGIGAWNYPLQIACWKSAPALACGNAMIFKPSELTPLTALKLAEIYTEAGVPSGVFNVIQGAAEAGQLLSRHPEIAKVSFTGEVGTGKKVMADAAGSLKYITMELGGKSPLIVFEDADIPSAINAALLANFFTQGEICTNGTRVFVHENVYPHFLDQITQRVKQLKVGDPMDPQTHIGALISREHLQRVQTFIDNARNSGARLVCGGSAPDEAELARGNFLQPAIFTNCTDDMEFVREEIFGPVMAALSFRTEEEVIARANNTRYGLAAGVFTRDIHRAHRVVARLEAGTCWINNYNITPIEMPLGGVKESGIGRENSLATIEHYTQLKSVYVEMNPVPDPFGD
ncbi:MAG: betaine-aldehyde dehydrogenase [Leptospiraceae bacterium]|nr:betaine-aldehyde dehydrogenase [Leptospiraceae bacterium]